MEKSYYLIKVSGKEYEGGNGYEEDDFDSIPLLGVYLHEQFLTAREHAKEIVKSSIPAFHLQFRDDNPNSEPEEVKKEEPGQRNLADDDKKDKEEDEDDEFQGIVLKVIDKIRQKKFDIIAGENGNWIGPCCCVRDGYRFHVSIEKIDVLP